MAEQDQITALEEQAEDLVNYVQDYQGQIAEKTFQLVQANATARKLQRKLTDAEQALREAKARIAELEAESEAAKAAPEEETAVQKTARKGAASQ